MGCGACGSPGRDGTGHAARGERASRERAAVASAVAGGRGPATGADDGERSTTTGETPSATTASSVTGQTPSAATASTDDGAPVAAGLEEAEASDATPAAADDALPETGHRIDRFLTHDDAPILEALSSEPIAEAERGRGGRSLGFRVTLADGTRAYFKPDQTFNGMSWNAEIAAHHLDRTLGLGRVAPVVGRTFDWADLEAAAGHDGRIDEIRVDEEGTVHGALIWWVPERLVPVELPEGWEAWLRQDGQAPAVTPFQRPGTYRTAMARLRAARAARERGEEPAAVPTQSAPEGEGDPERLAELSDLIVFDYLTHNLDRWGTNNTNVRTVGAGGSLMFLDNAASFTLRSPRIALMDLRLAQAERFRRSTIDAVRALDVDAYAATLADDPRGPLLSDRQIANLRVRRRHLLAHVDALIEEHGEDAVFPWEG